MLEPYDPRNGQRFSRACFGTLESPIRCRSRAKSRPGVGERFRGRRDVPDSLLAPAHTPRSCRSPSNASSAARDKVSPTLCMRCAAKQSHAIFVLQFQRRLLLALLVTVPRDMNHSLARELEWKKLRGVRLSPPLSLLPETSCIRATHNTLCTVLLVENKATYSCVSSKKGYDMASASNL